MTRLLSTRASQGTLASLVAIPLLVLAVCLATFWSPSDHTQGLPVALVNLDDGYESNGTETNAGDDLVKQVTDDASMRWETTDAGTAERGLENGDYAFVVTIPADFSERLARSSSLDAIATSVAATGSDTSGALRSATIGLEYNDAAGPQTRALGERAMETIRKALSQSTGQTTASTLLVTIGQLDQGLATAASGADALGKGADALGQGADQLGQGLGQLSSGSSTLAQGTSALATGLSQLDTQMPALTQGIGQLSAGASGVAAGSQALATQVNDLAAQANGYRDQALAIIDQMAAQSACTSGNATRTADSGDAQAGAATGTADGADPQTGVATGTEDGTDADAANAGDGQGTSGTMPDDSPDASADSSPDEVAQAPSTDRMCAALTQARSRIAAIPDLTQIEQVKQIGQLAQGAQAVADGLAAFDEQSQALTGGIAQLAQGAQAVNTGTQALAQGAQAAAQGTDALSKGAGQLTGGITQLGDGLRQGADAVPTLSIGGMASTGAASKATSEAGASGTGVVAQGADAQGADDGQGKSDQPSETDQSSQYGQSAQEGFGASDTASAMAALDALNALRNTTAVMTDPVQVSADVSNEASTLGLAIAPWALTFALALGALLSWMVFGALPRRALASTLPGWRAVLAAFGPAALVAVAQTLAMLAVLVWGAGVRPAGPWALVPFALLAALSLMSLQQLLVLAWGRRFGMIAAIVLYAFGLMSGGGLLPQAVTPMLMRVVGPFLPTTYAMGGLRVALTGGSSGALTLAVAVLSLLTVACLAGSSLIAERRKVWTVSRLHAA